jgi:hypothetical protein
MMRMTKMMMMIVMMMTDVIVCSIHHSHRVILHAARVGCTGSFTVHEPNNGDGDGEGDDDGVDDGDGDVIVTRVFKSSVVQ